MKTLSASSVAAQSSAAPYAAWRLARGISVSKSKANLGCKPKAKASMKLLSQIAIGIAVKVMKSTSISLPSAENHRHRHRQALEVINLMRNVTNSYRIERSGERRK